MGAAMAAAISPRPCRRELSNDRQPPAQVVPLDQLGSSHTLAPSLPPRLAPYYYCYRSSPP